MFSRDISTLSCTVLFMITEIYNFSKLFKQNNSCPNLIFVPHCNSSPSHQTVIRFYTYHESRTVVSCARFYCSVLWPGTSKSKYSFNWIYDEIFHWNVSVVWRHLLNLCAIYCVNCCRLLISDIIVAFNAFQAILRFSWLTTKALLACSQHNSNWGYVPSSAQNYQQRLKVSINHIVSKYKAHRCSYLS